jgi:hypothetical protein
VLISWSKAAKQAEWNALKSWSWRTHANERILELYCNLAEKMVVFPNLAAGILPDCRVLTTWDGD